MLSLRSVASVFALIACGAFGCVINVGEDDCSKCDNAPRCHSHLDAQTEECSCDPGHQWANPGNENDFECRKIRPKPGTSQCVEENSYVMGDSCFCDAGYIWCQPDPADLTCCVDENQATVETGDAGTETDATGSAESGGRVVELPECTAELEGELGCETADATTPEATLQCVGGAWTAFDQDAHCQETDAGDFSYGCVFQSMTVEVLCGRGPGSECTADDQACIDDATLHVCVFGRLTARGCQMWCTGEEGFEQGACTDNDCACCNDSDGSCPS